MAAFADADQARVDEAVRALAWSLYKPEHARELAELAVADTGLGNVADKVSKNQRKTFGTLRDLLRARSVGVIEEDRGERHRQIRQARGRGRRASRPRPIPAPTPGQQGDDGAEGPQRHHHRALARRLPTTARTVELMRAELAKDRPAGRPRADPAAAGRPRTRPKR